MTGLVVSLLVVLAQSSAANAAKDAAAARFDRAKGLYDEGRYDDAAELFRQLHESTGEPVLLFSIAQSLRLAGRCAAALTAYQSFLEAESALKEKAAAASAGSEMKRVVTDLQLARARVVEMRVCASRSHSDPARQAAFRRLAVGEHVEALKVLQQIRDEKKDPTLLAEMAEIHRGHGQCDEAARLLDLAVGELTPIEILGTENPGRDAAMALESLRRARTAKLDFRCAVAPALPDPAAEADDGPVTVTQALVSPSAATDLQLDHTAGPRLRPRWPLYVAAGGAVVAVGGLASWAMMKRTEGEFERHLRLPLAMRDESYDQRRGDLYRRGENYQRLGEILFGAGASVAVASAAYWFYSSASPAATAVVQPQPGGVTFAVHSKF